MSARNSFLLKPIGKDYLWGGSRLNDDFNLGLDLTPLAEAWVCSTHPDGKTNLISGESLLDVLKRNPDFLGEHATLFSDGDYELPIMIKLIDAKRDLSVQVHPDDSYAKEYEDGSRGKTEMWYVIDAKPDSALIYGFNKNVSATEVRLAVENGSIRKLLNFVSVTKNDVFTINPGTVHAIGEGCLIAEIQENSNVTYRLYDYDRTDKNGCKRKLHLGKALDVLDFSFSDVPRQPMRVLKYKKGFASELLSRCKYFQVERLIINTESLRDTVQYKTASNSFHVLLCIEGCGSICSKSINYNYYKGDCIFAPADCEMMSLHGKSQFLDVCC